MKSATVRLVLRLAGEQALASGHSYLDHQALEVSARAQGLAHDELFSGLRELVLARLVDMHFVEPSLITLLRLTGTGLRRHLDASRADLAGVRIQVLLALREELVDWRDGAAVDLAGALGEPYLLVESLMEDLRRDGLVFFSPAPDRRLRVHRLVS